MLRPLSYSYLHMNGPYISVQTPPDWYQVPGMQYVGGV